MPPADHPDCEDDLCLDASGEGSVWGRQVDGTVQRIDGSSGKLLSTFATEAADSFGDIVLGGGFVWINSRSVALIQADPQTNSQRSMFDPPPLWLGGSAVFRIKLPE